MGCDALELQSGGIHCGQCCTEGPHGAAAKFDAEEFQAALTGCQRGMQTVRVREGLVGQSMQSSKEREAADEMEADRPKVVEPVHAHRELQGTVRFGITTKVLAKRRLHALQNPIVQGAHLPVPNCPAALSSRKGEGLEAVHDIDWPTRTSIGCAPALGSRGCVTGLEREQTCQVSFQEACWVSEVARPKSPGGGALKEWRRTSGSTRGRGRRARSSRQ